MCTNIHGQQRIIPNDFGDPLIFPLELRFCLKCLYSIGWVTTPFGTDIHGPLKMNSSDFADPLTFHLSPSSGDRYISHQVLISCGLGMPRDPPGGVRKRCWGEGCLDYLTWPAVSVTRPQISRWTDGWTIIRSKLMTFSIRFVVLLSFAVPLLFNLGIIITLSTYLS